MVIKTVAIDMIGVFINEMRIVSNRLYNMLEDKSIISKEDLKKNYDIGISPGKLSIEEFWKNAGIENWEEYEYNFLLSLKFDSNSKAFLEEYYKSFNFIMVTDLPTRWAEIILKQHDIYKYFNGIICGDTKNGSKKDGSSYKELIKNDKAEEIIVVDDTLKHIQTASNLGLNVVHYTNEKDSNNDYKTIGNFLELGDYLNKYSPTQ